ncbi:hypothetical protein KG089_01445 [Carnobacteriaceae bacterium zg-ZUI252]|nr:hypothetical protein [Carnobacteriaceae bacterium zg-ZUI252]
MVQKVKFKVANYKELRQIEQSLQALYKAAAYFKTYFIGKKVVYCTLNNEVEVYFSESNFMHLCGLYYPKGTKKFFRDCLDKCLNVSSLLVKKDGTTMQKLQILASVSDLTSPYVRLTGSGKYLHLEFDYALRTKKQILALTLKEAQRKLIPQSLLDLKRLTIFPKGETVIKIYAIKHDTKEEITYYCYEEES